MSLIIEDGSIVSGANSYATRASLISYAAAAGTVLPNTDATDALLVRAARYISSLETRLKGRRVERDQPLSYPRKDLVLLDEPWDDDEIPDVVIEAQMAVALDLNASIDPFNPASSLPIVEETVQGAVTVRYASPSAVSNRTQQTAARALLRILMKGGSSGPLLERI
jgi:hypothetical protein